MAPLLPVHQPTCQRSHHDGVRVLGDQEEGTPTTASDRAVLNDFARRRRAIDRPHVRLALRRGGFGRSWLEGREGSFYLKLDLALG